MANFTETKTPYEFLVRFNEQGQIQGAHVGFLEKVLKDGELISTKIGDVIPVSIGLEQGFPLSEILNTIQIEALKNIEILNAEKALLLSEKSALLQMLPNIQDLNEK